MATRWNDPVGMRIRPTRVYADRVGEGWNGTDDTDVLQAAINSGAGEVVIRQQAGAWVTTPLTLASNQKIIFHPGVQILAKAGGFTNTTDCLFKAQSKKNISLVGRGAGVKLTMLRAEYATGEDRHGILILGCQNVHISGLTIEDCGGDGIYVGGDVGLPDTSRNITIRNCTCDNVMRNGIAIERGIGVLVEDVTCSDANGKSPETGIDIEPKAADAELSNIVIRRAATTHNKRGGIYLALNNLTSASDAIDVTLEGCTSTTDGYGGTAGSARGALAILTKNAAPVTGSIVVNNHTITDSTLQAVLLTNKPAAGPSVEFHDCTITNPAADVASRPPIWFESAGNATTCPNALSGYVFDNVVINDAVSRDPMEFYNGADPDVALQDITGEITVTYTVTPTTTVYPLTTAQLQSWIAAYAVP